MIYEYALGGEMLELSGRPNASDHSGIGLLLVNRQIYQEAALLFYSGNTFINNFQVAFDEFVQRRTQEQLDAINTIGLRTFRGREMMGDDESLQVQTFAFLATILNMTRIKIQDWTCSEPPGEVVEVVVKCTELEQHSRAWCPKVDIVFIDKGHLWWYELLAVIRGCGDITCRSVQDRETRMRTGNRRRSNWRMCL
jgi:hypothetical protein